MANILDAYQIYTDGVQPEILAHIVTNRNGKNHSCWNMITYATSHLKIPK